MSSCGVCGAMGTCQLKPKFCGRFIDRLGVCTCASQEPDGKSHIVNNECWAHVAGASVARYATSYTLQGCE
jgi:hypothetical protein